MPTSRPGVCQKPDTLSPAGSWLYAAKDREMAYMTLQDPVQSEELPCLQESFMNFLGGYRLIMDNAFQVKTLVLPLLHETEDLSVPCVPRKLDQST